MRDTAREFLTRHRFSQWKSSGQLRNSVKTTVVIMGCLALDPVNLSQLHGGNPVNIEGAEEPPTCKATATTAAEYAKSGLLAILAGPTDLKTLPANCVFANRQPCLLVCGDSIGTLTRPKESIIGKAEHGAKIMFFIHSACHGTHVCCVPGPLKWHFSKRN